MCLLHCKCTRTGACHGVIKVVHLIAINGSELFRVTTVRVRASRIPILEYVLESHAALCRALDAA
jgi:hypothetical protein